MSPMRFSNFFLRMSTIPASEESNKMTSASTNKDQDESPLNAESQTLRPKDQNQDPAEQIPRKRPIDNESDDTVPKKFAKVDERFDLSNKDKTNSWNIKAELAEYAIKQMNSYINDSDIEILYQNPVPVLILITRRTWILTSILS